MSATIAQQCQVFGHSNGLLCIWGCVQEIEEEEAGLIGEPAPWLPGARSSLMRILRGIETNLEHPTVKLSADYKLQGQQWVDVARLTAAAATPGA